MYSKELEHKFYEREIPKEEAEDAVNRLLAIGIDPKYAEYFLEYMSKFGIEIKKLVNGEVDEKTIDDILAYTRKALSRTKILESTEQNNIVPFPKKRNKYKKAA